MQAAPRLAMASHPAPANSIRPCRATFGYHLSLRCFTKRDRTTAIRVPTNRPVLAQPRRSKQNTIFAAAADQASSSNEAAALQSELAALDATLAAVQGQVEAAEASSRAEREAQAAYEAEISDLNTEISARKQQRQAAETAAEAEDVKRMISRVEALKEEAASLNLILTERKDEISGLKRQLAEFEETVEPMRAFANVGLREREAGGGVATVNGPSWDNDWGNVNIPRPKQFAGRRLPDAPAAFSMAPSPKQSQASTQNIIRSGSAPGLLLAAGAMGIGSFWKKIKQAFPPEGRSWLDLSAISVLVGAFLYNAYQQ